MGLALSARVRGGRPASTGRCWPGVVERTVELAVAEGMNREVLTEAAGLGRLNLADPDSRVPVSTQVALWQLIAKSVADPGFAVRGGASLRAREAGLVGYVMSFSATLGAALGRFVRYSRVLNDAVGSRLDAPDRQHVAIAVLTRHWGWGSRSRWITGCPRC